MLAGFVRIVAALAVSTSTFSASQFHHSLVDAAGPAASPPRQTRVLDCSNALIADLGEIELAQARVLKPKPDQKAFQDMLSYSYPPELYMNGIGGDVLVSFCISKTGETFNHRLVKSSGYPALDKATMEGLPKICWKPARDTQGRPVEICHPPYPLTVSWRPPAFHVAPR